MEALVVSKSGNGGKVRFTVVKGPGRKRLHGTARVFMAELPRLLSRVICVEVVEIILLTRPSRIVMRSYSPLF